MRVPKEKPEPTSSRHRTLSARLTSLGCPPIANCPFFSVYRLLETEIIPTERTRIFSELTARTNISSATPRDLCQFLAWKDEKGKTQVHQINCRFLGHRPCDCPIRLAYGTVDSLIGKLRAIFNEEGEWDPRLLIGNPATDLSLKKYLRIPTRQIRVHERSSIFQNPYVQWR